MSAAEGRGSPGGAAAGGGALEKRIVIHAEDGVTQIAILEARRLVELHIEHEDECRLVGNIYKGKVSNVLPGMQSAFVDIGAERDVFLHVGDLDRGPEEDERPGEPPPPAVRIEERLEIGQEIVIQVMKDPIGTKGARGKTYLTLPGRYVVLLPSERRVGVSRKIEDPECRERLRALGESICPPDAGIIIRTVAVGRTDREIRADVEFLHALWGRIRSRISRAPAPSLLHNELSITLKVARDLCGPDVAEILVDDRRTHDLLADFFETTMPLERCALRLDEDSPPLFERFGVNRQIERLLQPKVWLDCGGYLIIQKTEALTAIDVNTGKFTGGSGGGSDLETTVARVNLEAAAEVGRQVRLRDIGGIIIVDFIDMERPENKEAVLKALRESFAGDRAKTNISGITDFGLVEITRRRMGKSLMELLQAPCEYCQGTGRTLASNVVSKKAREEIRRIARATDAATIRVTVHPEVARALAGEEEVRLRRLEGATGKTIAIESDERYHVEEIRISAE